MRRELGFFGSLFAFWLSQEKEFDEFPKSWLLIHVFILVR